MQIVAEEIPDPVGIEFRMVSDKMKIGRTMDSALNDTADRLGVAILDDVDTDASSAVAAAQALLAKVDRVHLTLDLDVIFAQDKPSARLVTDLPFPAAVDGTAALRN